MWSHPSTPDSFHSKTRKQSHTTLLGLAFHSLRDFAGAGILFAYFGAIVTGLAT